MGIEGVCIVFKLKRDKINTFKRCFQYLKVTILLYIQISNLFDTLIHVFYYKS